MQRTWVSEYEQVHVGAKGKISHEGQESDSPIGNSSLSEQCLLSLHQCG